MSPGELAALSLYREHLGMIISVRRVYGFQDFEIFDFNLDVRALVRVLFTPEKHILEVLKGYPENVVDSRWVVELVEKHPELDDCKFLWIEAVSFEMESGKMESTPEWKLAYEDK